MYDYSNQCVLFAYKFTGKERDLETGNDDFGARYYSSGLGRWLSPDWSSAPAPVPYANLNNPQTLNLYAMVADNPETFADLDGHDVKDFVLLVSGPNQVPNTPHPELPDVSTLGPKETMRGAYFAYNTQANFEEGDNPADYKPLREAYILRNEGDVGEERRGGAENPSKSQIANRGSSQFVFDSPGVSVSKGPTAALNGKLDVAFSLAEKNTKTGQVSQQKFYYRVTLVVKDGKIVGSQATPISEKEFRRITGQDKKKPKQKKGKDKDGSGDGGEG